MKAPYIFYLLSLAFITLPYSITGQEKLKGRVIDSITKKGVANAHWKMVKSDLEGYTSKSGKFSFKSDQIDTLVIQQIGYHSDTISNFKNGDIINLQKITPQDILPVSSNLERGQIQDGYKIGVWEYYDRPDTLSLKIDYDQGILLFAAKDTSQHAIEVNGQWEYAHLDIAPRYIGSHSAMSILIAQNRTPLPKIIESEQSAEFYISFEVNLSGQASNYTIVDERHTKYGSDVISAIEEIPNLWIVAQKDNIKYKSRLLFPVIISVEMDDEKIQPKHTPNKKTLPIGKLLNPIQIKLRASSRKSRTIIRSRTTRLR